MGSKEARGIVFVLLVLLFIAGCAPQRIAQTISGRPEILIHTTDIDLVKNTILNDMTSSEYVLHDDSKYRLAFTRQMEGGGAIMSQFALGNAYSTTPVAEISFSFAKIAQNTKVIVMTSVSTQMAFGQTNRYDMKDNNAWFNEFQKYLQNVKTKIEKQTIGS